jgi:uncharacterized membrane protein
VKSFTKNQIMKSLDKIWRSLVGLSLVILLVLGGADQALAKRGGGRIGGGAFRRTPAPTRVIRPSNPGNYTGSYNGYRSPAPGYGYGGGFSFFPFIPFMIGGGGNLLSFLVLVAVAGAVLQTFRGIGGQGISQLDSKVTLTKVQVGLLAGAKKLQQDLSDLAETANTSDTNGLSLILREATVSLLRHPEYWIYVRSAKEVSQFEQAEQKFQALTMSERSKLSAEVITNVNSRKSSLVKHESESPLKEQSEDPSEYVVVTLLVAATGDALSGMTSDIRTAQDLQQALASLGSIPSDRLLAIELLWEPQSPDYTLSSDQVLSVYPDLIRL